MTDSSAPPLLFGPYPVPACKVGDELVCKVRGRVVVAAFGRGPIPWPVAWGRGGQRLIVCDGLARAVRRESAAAVAHWWGVAVSTVWTWRKMLSSGRTAPPPRRWTEAEDRLVRAMAPEEVARWTGRSLRAVYARRSALGVNEKIRKRRG